MAFCIPYLPLENCSISQLRMRLHLCYICGKGSFNVCSKWLYLKGKIQLLLLFGFCWRRVTNETLGRIRDRGVLTFEQKLKVNQFWPSLRFWNQNDVLRESIHIGRSRVRARDTQFLKRNRLGSRSSPPYEVNAPLHEIMDPPLMQDERWNVKRVKQKQFFL